MTRSGRIAAGRLVALLYLFCVLAPCAALAMGAGPAPCLDELPVAALEMPAMHMYDGMVHHHERALEKSSQRVDAAGHHEHHHHGHAGPGPCCAMLCIPGMTADLPSFLAPRQVFASYVSAPDRSLRGEAPARLYRPPIT